MKLNDKTFNTKRKRALITCIVKVLVSYVIIPIFCQISLILLRNMRIATITDKSKTRMNNSKNGYLVGWLTTLAQPHPSIIKTDDKYAKYSESQDVGRNFYLIQTLIEDKSKLHTENDASPDSKVAFYVSIYRMAEYDTFYSNFITCKNRVISGIKHLWPWSRVSKPEVKEGMVHLTQQQYKRIRYRSIKKLWFQQLIRGYKNIDKSIHLRLELIETIPCGVCQFEVTPIRLKDNDYSQIDEQLWKCVFDEVHCFFHEHHFTAHKPLPANLPRFNHNRTEISTLNNGNIRFYLETIGVYLTSRLDEIYRSYQDLLVLNKGKREKGQRKIGDKKLIESAMNFFENCDNLIGIHSFLCSVINSPQNTNIILGKEISCEKDIIDRETAMKIESAYRGTIALMQKISHHHDFRNNHKSLQKAKRGIYWSIGFGIAGLILSLILAYDKWKDNIVDGVKWLEGKFLSLLEMIVGLFQ